ncbi:hypothetical protein XM75_c21041 [Vibrio vulnificus]|uniref:P-loop NTPase fold protein n=1 Tax=Vibrio vulnificus TaxID=672 RepID=UPI0009B67607|nr:P-loop NTPase fold protein [Vibrio vulnificus]EGQ8086477.1 hypothetical protein [Vibrio vulnificus]EHH0793278.1 hypothetical protein [Vibrio vulnificus]EHH0796092.1 hypothetical protein [Vibrio vulnificus]EHK9014868.1 hypothetical protein [Vibrio vulnificus]EHU4994847.1 hypothetical protein [Vibrio vulnificus]
MSVVVPKEETFDNYKLIDRKPFANYLIAFLNTKAEEGYVINLNAEWGAGKTTFLQCWYNELSKEHPTIYFDAWRSDFSKDAMLALIDCFHAQLANPITDNQELIKSLFDKGSYFIRKSIPSLLIGLLSLKQKTEGISIEELSSLPSHKSGSGIFIVCDTYRLNPRETPANNEGYTNILNLAGHFD